MSWERVTPANKEDEFFPEEAMINASGWKVWEQILV